MQWKVGLLLWVMTGSVAAQGPQIDFSSATDFTRMEMLIKDDQGANPDHVQLDVTLDPRAAERAQKVSQAAIGQPLTLSINGLPISTATVHSALGAKFRISMSRAVAKILLPTLIE